MNEKRLNVGVCDFCNKLKVNRTYFVYRIHILTSHNEYTDGLLNVYEQLSDFLMEEGLHISASQAIIMRPDITLRFLKFKYDTEEEKVLAYHLEEMEICFTCFEKFKEEVPER